jgi:PAS domain S-box-containing protein
MHHRGGKGGMISQETCFAILDTINHPIVYVDNDHVIRYLNKAAEERYYKVKDYSDLIGKSIFDCHAQKSREQITEHYKRLQAGENEIIRPAPEIGRKFTTVAVRDKNGNLLGYYEKSEKMGNTGKNATD